MKAVPIKNTQNTDKFREEIPVKLEALHESQSLLD